MSSASFYDTSSKNPRDDEKQDNSSTENNEEKRDRQFAPEQFRKVFIGGLSHHISENMLNEYFSKYGEIVDCVVMTEATGRSRGFGFVTYSEPSMVDDLMSHRPHVIDRREVDVKRAMPKESVTPEIHLAVNKIFIGAIRGGITEDDLKEYFGRFGRITDAVVMRDPNGKVRGFGFVEFDDCDSVDRIVLEKNHTVNGQALDVKKAIPKKMVNQSSNPSSINSRSRQLADLIPNDMDSYSRRSRSRTREFGSTDRHRSSGGQYLGPLRSNYDRRNYAEPYQRDRFNHYDTYDSPSSNRMSYDGDDRMSRGLNSRVESSRTFDNSNDFTSLNHSSYRDFYDSRGVPSSNALDRTPMPRSNRGGRPNGDYYNRSSNGRRPMRSQPNRQRQHLNQYNNNSFERSTRGRY